MRAAFGGGRRDGLLRLVPLPVLEWASKHRERVEREAIALRILRGLREEQRRTPRRISESRMRSLAFDGGDVGIPETSGDPRGDHEDGPQREGAHQQGHAGLRGSAFAPAVTGLTADSRDVRPGELFVAVPGTQQDGAEFVADALRAGAAAVCATAPVAGVPTLVADDPRKALADLAAAYYRWPARDVALVGITGSLGKTSTALLTQACLAGGRVRKRHLPRPDPLAEDGAEVGELEGREVGEDVHGVPAGTK